jgi:OPT family oligopeptide transporter
VLATIYYFKPQTVYVSVIFLAVISYVLGELMEKLIPKGGFIGRWFNPHKFNHKEHAAIVIMSSAAANCALGTEVLAVQRLYYSTSPNAGASIFLLFSSQLLGYGIAGLMRKTLVYPTKMLYPINLPLNTLLETLHRDKKETAKRLKLFYIMFCVLFVWETFPEYIMPIMTGVSIFCLAKRDSLVFTNLFGGTNGNEGLGFLSWCMDWQYIAGTQSPLWFPLQTLVNNLVGYMLCIFVFMGVYYMNIWNAQDFPFLSQLLFSNTSNSTVYQEYNQTAVLNSDNILDPVALEQLGIPYFATTYAVYILSTNLAITATFTHMFLWNYNDIKSAWGFASMQNLRSYMRPSSWNWRFWSGDERNEDIGHNPEGDIDPHYRLMLVYKDSPDWWYGLVLVASIITGLVCLYEVNSTLPWWGFLVACLLSSICILFFGAQYAITGFQFIIQPIIQMIGGYLHPGYPVANMYFTLFGYNSVSQAQLLLKDLKIAQYAKLPPRCTFTVQMVGTIIGAIFNYIMMVSIVDNQRDILLSIEGTNIWSGQNVQQYNSQAIAWGALASHMCKLKTPFDSGLLLTSL